jgi:hypothetical protein
MVREGTIETDADEGDFFHGMRDNARDVRTGKIASGGAFGSGHWLVLNSDGFVSVWTDREFRERHTPFPPGS